MCDPHQPDYFEVLSGSESSNYGRIPLLPYCHDQCDDDDDEGLKGMPRPPHEEGGCLSQPDS